MKHYPYYIFVFLIFSLMACDDSHEFKKTKELKKVEPVTHYYRLKEKVNGGEFYDFIYMYPIKKENLKQNTDYYQVDYDGYGREKKSTTIKNKKEIASTLYFYRPDHQINKVEWYKFSKLNSYMTIDYKDDQELQLTIYSPDKKIFMKRVNEYKDGVLIKSLVYTQDIKNLEMRYEYDKESKKVNYYKKGLLKSIEYYNRQGRLIQEEIIPKKKIEYFYYNSGLLQKEKMYQDNGLYQTIEYDYNPRGDRIQVAIFNNKSLPAGRWLYLNDEGKLDKIDIYFDGQLALTKKMIYSNDGYLRKEENWKGEELRSYYLYTYDKNTTFITEWIKYNPSNQVIGREEFIYDNNILVERNNYKGEKLAKRYTLEKGKWKEEVFIKDKEKNISPAVESPSHLPEESRSPEEYVSGIGG